LLLETLFFIFIIITATQVLYYTVFFSRFALSFSHNKAVKNFPVSVIICAKNEAKNLNEFLPLLINQNYTDFELILVNDNSTDDTLKVMENFKTKNSNIQIVNLINDSSKGNKKNALTKGIEAAKHEHLLFTDADCKPNSVNWIKEMTSHFNKKKSIILGYGAYQKIDHSWLNKLIRFETLITAIQYFSYAKIGLPYMGVGRNIAYTKSQFQKANGFTKHKHIKSGDDDLFINQIATKLNIACCYSQNSFTISKPHTKFKKWIYQKRRHLTTATSYKFIHQFLLGLFYLTQFLFWFLALILFLANFNWKIVLVIFILRILMQYLIFGFSAKKLNESDLIILIPFLELFLIIIQLRIFMQNLISKPKEW
jgi:glycosyltransferase involved in cell wall biosynthesis